MNLRRFFQSILNKSTEAQSDSVEADEKPAQPVTGHDAEASRKNAQWLKWGAWLPESLGVCLAVAWASQAHDGAYLRWVFAVGLAGFVIFKTVAVPEAVAAFKRGDRTLGYILAGLALGSALMLFGAGVFELVNSSGNAAQSRIESSKPAEALDAQIAAARERLAGLAKFADGSLADKEAAAIASAETARQAKISELQGKVSAALEEYPINQEKRKAAKTLGALTAGCTNSSWYASTYCRPVADMRAEIDRLKSGGAGAGEYGNGHQQYLGVQQHLAALLQQRAALSESGQGIAQAYRVEDRLLAKVFNVDAEKANWGKWFVIAALLDSFGMWARWAAALILFSLGGDPRRELFKKIEAMITLGLNPLESLQPGGAAAIPLQPAGVELPVQLPLLHTGAKITADGAAIVHRGEVVLNVAAVEAIERLYPGLLSSANNGKPLEREAVKRENVYGKPLEESQTVKRQAVGAGSGVCRHCGGGFVVTRKDRHYCGDACRVARWESATGAKLVKGKGKKAA